MHLSWKRYWWRMQLKWRKGWDIKSYSSERIGWIWNYFERLSQKEYEEQSIDIMVYFQFMGQRIWIDWQRREDSGWGETLTARRNAIKVYFNSSPPLFKSKLLSIQKVLSSYTRFSTASKEPLSVSENPTSIASGPHIRILRNLKSKRTQWASRQEKGTAVFLPVAKFRSNGISPWA